MSTSDGAFELSFVPGEPPRLGGFVAWVDNRGAPTLRPTDPRHSPGLHSGLTDQVVVALPSGASVRRQQVRGRRLTPAEAIGVLLEGESTGGGEGAHRSPSVGAWSAVLVAALGALARGRLFPAVTAGDVDAWCAGPLDRHDREVAEALAAALPPAAHAVVPAPMRSGQRPRLATPEHLVAACYDWLADTLVRTAGAAAAAGDPRWAAADLHHVGELQDWLAEADGGLDGPVAVALRVELDGPVDFGRDGPGGADAATSGGGANAGGALARGVLQLTPAADPSLVLDAAELLTAPPAVRARFGDETEIQLMLSLRRAAKAWPPMAPLLRQRAPEEVVLDEDAVEELLTASPGPLEGTGIDVLWPAEILTDGLVLQARLSSVPSPPGGPGSGFDLRSLVEFHWEATLGGEVLSAEELDQLAEAKRGLARIRGRWVRVDPTALERLRSARSRRLGAAEALGALLGGTVELDGESVQVTADGELAELAARLQAVTGSAGIGVDPDSAPAPPGLKADLRPYQRRGVAWLREMTRTGIGACLADDMGLGKTVQVIALHLHRHTDGSTAVRGRGASKKSVAASKKSVAATTAESDITDSALAATADPSVAGSTLVVCPTSLLGNWEREVTRFAPGIAVRRFHGTGRELGVVAPGEIVLTTYGVVRRDRRLLAGAGFSMVVADEAQHAKNPLSDTARALREVPAQARVALTGTPVENRLSELWSILDWTTPGLLGPLDRFRRTVAVPVERYRDPDATERLSRVVRPFLLRRRKTDPAIAPDLPARTVTDRPVPLSTEQTTLYEAEVREALAAIEHTDGIKRKGLVLRLLTVLKQICNHPAQYLKQDGPLAGRSGKLAALEELLDVILSEGDSVLVFSQFVECLRLVERRLGELGTPTLFLHGAVPVRRRQEIVDRFQAGEVPVLLLSLKAGGVGLNLTRATHVVHFDRWWNPAVEDQATDRAHRIGQDRAVQVHRLIAEHTLEDRIAVLLEKKRALAESVVGGGEAWLAELTDEALAELVSLGGPASKKTGGGGARRARGAGAATRTARTARTARSVKRTGTAAAGRKPAPAAAGRKPAPAAAGRKPARRKPPPR